MAFHRFKGFRKRFLLLPVLALAVGCGGGGSGSGGGAEVITAPVITAQPTDQTVPLNVGAVFAVAASGGHLSYQWERSDDSGTTWSPISGATAASCSITSAGKTTASLRCTLTNPVGSLTSAVAELAVVAVVFSDRNAAPGGDGTSWTKACQTLQAALATAGAGSEIWAAAGSYTPTTGTDRASTFALKPEVAVYGGFTGRETCRQGRNWWANGTILSGDIGTAGEVADNCYHVVTGTDNATLDGFTITAGNANAIYPNRSGGGMFNLNCSPTVINCTFLGNLAGSAAEEGYGGGMFNWGGAPVVINCTFSGNSATEMGGGMHNYQCSTTVVNGTFSDNLANTGGGMSNDSSSVALTNCVFSGNAATNTGGGMFNSGNNPLVTNCTFLSNTGASGAGGMSNSASNPAVINCLFKNNTAVLAGGIYNMNCSPTVTNCTFYNSDPVAEIFNYSSSPIVTNCILWSSSVLPSSKICNYNAGCSPVVRYSCVQGWGAPDAANHILIDDPMLTADLTLQPASPCIDSGDDSGVPAGVVTDLAGNPRFSAHVDFGAYEYQP